MSVNDLLKQLSDFIVIDLTILRVVLALLFVLLGLVFRQIFVKGISKLLLHLSKKTKTNLDDLMVFALEKPARALILGFSLWAALSIIGLPLSIQNFLNLIIRSFFIFVLFWFFYRGSECMVWVFERFFNKTDKKVDPVLVRFLRKSLKIIIVVLGIFMVLIEWDYNVSSLIAGLGVGGLAFALAAKDAVSNLLGSITIMLDKPFSLGDWIKTDSAEGVVEEIGFRSTKIRTFAQAVISVPNSIMSNEPVTNWSRMGKRQITYTLQIPIDTHSEKIEALLSKLREMLKNHPDIHQESIMVNLQGFRDATLEVFFYFFTKTTSWDIFLSVKEDVNLKVLQIFEEIDIPITLPTNRMFIESKESNTSTI